MYIIDKKIISKKYMQLIDTLKEDKLRKLFSNFDSLIIKKRFNDARELSLTENVLINDYVNVTKQDVIKIIKDFIKCKKNKNFFKKSYLYEFLKLTNLDKNYLLKNINDDYFLKITDAINDIYKISEQISYDFMLLRIIDNLSLKLNTLNKIKILNTLKKDILNKIITYNYNKETREKETTYMCWIDILTTLSLNKNIKHKEFIIICNKILKLTNEGTGILWKIINAINFLSSQQKNDYKEELNNYKNLIYTNIEKINNKICIDDTFVINHMVKILAKNNPSKEDFYGLLDIITLFSKKSDDNKILALNLFKYIVENNKKQNIFCYKFIREYFIDKLFYMINATDSVSLLNEEIKILIMLFHIDSFYTFNRHIIFNSIVDVLRNIVLNSEKLTHSNFFKYCDILDFILAKNPDISFPEIIEYISANKIQKQRISKKFKLSQYYLNH